MPDELSGLALTGSLAGVFGALFVAALAAACSRTYPRPHLAPWAWSWLVAALATSLAAVSPVLPRSAAGAASSAGGPLRYLQAALFLIGLHALRHGRLPGARHRRLLAAGVAGLGALSAFTPAIEGPISWLFRSLLPSAVLGITLAGGGIALVWWTRSARSFANRLVGLALVGYGLARFDPLLALDPQHFLFLGLGLVDFALLSAVGLGLVLALLEEERRTAASAEAQRHEQELERERDRLRASEEKFSKVFRSSPDAITITSPWEGGLILDVNEGFERMTGYSAAEAVGRTTVELGLWVRPEDRLEGMTEVQAHGRVRDYEVELRMRSGEQRICLLSGEVVEVGGRQYMVAVTRDVTEQRLAERRLQESEERLRRALDAAQMGTWEWNIETGAVVWTPQVEALVGLPPGGFRGTFDAFKDTVHPEDRPRVEEAIRHALSSESGEFQVERRVEGADPARWLEVRGRVSRDAAGRPVLMRGTAVDVSERKRAEEALRQSETRSRALLEAMPDLMFRLSREGVHLDFHAPSPDALFAAPGDFLGKHLHDVLPAEVAERYLQHTRQALEQRTMQVFEYQLAFTPRDRRYYEARMTPCGSDDVLVIVRDVTEAKRSEEALRESEERWRRLSEASFEGIALSEGGVIFDVNAQLARMLGYSPQELIGMPVQNCVAPEDRARVAEAIRSAESAAYEHRALRKDGSTFLVEVRGRPSTLQGRTVRLTAVRDISERVRLERELRRRETLAAMGSLVAGVAHEVRTPLFSLSATLDALESGVASADQAQELRDLLRSQVRRLSTLMQDLLDYGRPPQLKLAAGSLGSVVDLAVRGCQGQALQAGVRIEVQVPADLSPVPIDAGRLVQVFENLLINALHHAPRGSTVGVCARTSADGVRCAVQDEGPGVPAADLERVFEPFVSRRKGGTGMGLAIAQRFVEAHGGSLTAGARPEGGAVFTVFLPTATRTGGALA